MLLSQVKIPENRTIAKPFGYAQGDKSAKKSSFRYAQDDYRSHPERSRRVTMISLMLYNLPFFYYASLIPDFVKINPGSKKPGV